MQRLVYTPRVEAYVKADTGIFDISPFITKGNVARRLDQVSSVELTIRNPDFKWTKYKSTDQVTGKQVVGPVFHPMDPITVTLTRLRNRPIQVFTGYLDGTPYLQLFPGTITLRGSCTLKRLLYTYFDPGLPFFNEFLTQHGWETNEQVGGIVNPTAEKALAKQTGTLTDSSFGELLHAALTEIGGWDDKNVFIENIPPNLIQLVTALFTEAAAEGQESLAELTDLLHQIIGTSSLGSGAVSSDPGGTPAGTGDWVRVGATYEGLDGAAGSCGHAVGGMAFADLLVAGANAHMKSQSIGAVLNIPMGSSGIPCGTKLEVRKPGGSNFFLMEKNDCGSGQAGNSHYKIDLQTDIADKLGGRTTQDIEVRVAGQGGIHR